MTIVSYLTNKTLDSTNKVKGDEEIEVMGGGGGRRVSIRWEIKPVVIVCVLTQLLNTENFCP